MSVLNAKFFGILWTAYHKRVYILPIKEHSNTQTLATVKLLSALLMFGIYISCVQLHFHYNREFN